ncbi:MAG: hypothetical protein LBV79_00710 [Candidatus Adiutrix sp.]|jgi:flagellar hook protein FlgE|nr:hypothetical protein [Candidatus Adiutrix sp.]
MPIGSLAPPLSAFSAYGVGLQSTAHNLANVLTEGFKAGRVTYSDLPRQSGVRANGPQAVDGAAPLVPHGPGLPEASGPGAPEGFAFGSTTDVAMEMVNLIVTSRAYQANAKTVQTSDQMLGLVVNLKV